MIRRLLWRLAAVLRWFRYPLLGLAMIIAAWYFGSPSVRNTALVVVGPFVAIMGVSLVAILLVVGPPAPRRPAPRQQLPALRAYAEVASPQRALTGQIIPRGRQLEGGGDR